MKKDKEQRRQAKLRKLRAKAKEELGPTHVVAKTPNGRTIQQLLIQAERNPNHYKDWCVRTTGRLIDWVSTYNIASAVGPAPVDGVELVHKRALHALYPKPFADNLWSTAMNRRKIQKVP